MRTITVNATVIGPRPSKPKTVRVRHISDYPSSSAAHLDVAQKLSSTLIMGPPICDELIAFVQHLFTEEESRVVRHLGGFIGKTAGQVAKAEHRPVEEVAPILRRLAFERHAIAATGPEGREKYRLMPVMPGVFEMVLFGITPDKMTGWHRRFAELFEALYDTGYAVDYSGHPAPLVRYLPVVSIAQAHPMALPSDQLGAILDRYRVFAIGQCQCRMTMQIMGKGCGRPLGNCAIMGDWAAGAIRQGTAREVARDEMLAIKLEAEKLGMANWMMNVESSKGQNSCSCCGCCCHAMRQVNEFNVPSLAAPPHFMPELDAAKCVYCGKCALACPMKALAVDPSVKTHERRVERCIGCGLCAVACDRKRALTMAPVPDYRLPPNSWFALLSRSIPKMLRNSWNAWIVRRRPPDSPA